REGSIHAGGDHDRVYLLLDEPMQRRDDPVEARDANVVDHVGLTTHFLRDQLRLFRVRRVRRPTGDDADSAAGSLLQPIGPAHDGDVGTGVLLDPVIDEVLTNLARNGWADSTEDRPARLFDERLDDGQDGGFVLASDLDDLRNARTGLTFQVEVREVRAGAVIRGRVQRFAQLTHRVSHGGLLRCRYFDYRAIRPGGLDHPRRGCVRLHTTIEEPLRPQRRGRLGAPAWHESREVAVDPASQRIDIEHTGPGTPAGRYLRSFWQPVGRSQDLAPGQSLPVLIMSERFTLYRGESGRAYVVAFRCAHRGTQLSSGWVE